MNNKSSKYIPTFLTGKKKIFIGKCIYCGSKEDLRVEHALPESLNGDLLLESASCRNCEVITGKFEARYTRDTLKPFRDYWGFKSKRRNKKRLQSFPMKLLHEDQVINVNVSKEDYMPVIPLWELGHPERFASLPHFKGLNFGEAKLVVFTTKSEEELINTIEKFNVDELAVEFPLYIGDFLRMIAKIAYCFALAKYGLNCIVENYVLDGILGKSSDLFRWVGNEGKQLLFEEGKQIKANHVVSAGLAPDGTIGVKIKLFKDMQTPEYLVIVGKVSDFYLSILKCAGYPINI